MRLLASIIDISEDGVFSKTSLGDMGTSGSDSSSFTASISSYTVPVVAKYSTLTGCKEIGDDLALGATILFRGSLRLPLLANAEIGRNDESWRMPITVFCDSTVVLICCVRGSTFSRHGGSPLSW